jgi:hypothetical protein
MYTTGSACWVGLLGLVGSFTATQLQWLNRGGQQQELHTLHTHSTQHAQRADHASTHFDPAFLPCPWAEIAGQVFLGSAHYKHPLATFRTNFCSVVQKLERLGVRLIV